MPQIRNAQLTATRQGSEVLLTVTYDVTFSAESAAPGPYQRRVKIYGHPSLSSNEALTIFSSDWIPYTWTAKRPRSEFIGGPLVPVTIGCVVSVEPTMQSVSPRRGTNEVVLPAESVRVPPGTRFADLMRSTLDQVGKFFIRLASRSRYDSLFDFQPDAAHIAALPEPIGRYIQQLQAGAVDLR